jgi:hypothetical protein
VSLQSALYEAAATFFGEIRKLYSGEPGLKVKTPVKKDDNRMTDQKSGCDFIFLS